ncbi:Tetratricopeptide TPR_1 repeat-containing protein [Oceanithermus profundus DSM 14977]|uniref:Tetratricopeptide TPR_1 repeat-containing protein n=1 Tax=Oceanithermus profundus (strain DSM 14977 / NBRC 100410 / VKM B-2274 / 506) TaxID=670487 RepID=E4U801_OCEP5|nr:tetratricopeptide repeat protein [Oceanithermus profundus]ADR36091.1 Tetratricopeptide TPR_1 repeat-containing protein [Oceanithermus profundus DSM 14977]
MPRHLSVLLFALALTPLIGGCKPTKAERAAAPPPAAAETDAAPAPPPALPPGAKAGPLDLSQIGPHDEAYAHESLSPDEWASVALMYQSKGRFGEALATLDQAIARHPENAHLYAVRGALWLQLEEYAKALADLERSLELAEDPGVRVNYAEALRRFDRKSDALASLDRALATNPDYLPALFNRGVLRFELGDEAGALADFDRAIAIDPAAAAPYFNRAAVRWALGQKEAAIADLDAFIERAPVGTWKETARDLRASWQEQLEAKR